MLYVNYISIKLGEKLKGRSVRGNFDDEYGL